MLGTGTATAAPAPHAPASAPPAAAYSVVAPYVDMAGPNRDNIGAAIDAGLTDVTAAFVIGKRCTPIWDDNEPVASDTAVTAAIQDAQTRGADVIVSFGGAAGKDLARTCTDVDALTTAYQSVIVKFGITGIDLDVEGDAIKARPQRASIARRFAAIRQLQSEDPDLVVSATLGVGPDGLPADQLSFLEKAKTSGTRIDLVNLMTMDYGHAVGDMGAAAVSAAEVSLTQLQSVWPTSTYANLGITPMIGQNDSAGEITTLDDARTIVSFAASNGVGRLAFWSLNRDQQCGRSDDRAHKAARNNCSGVKQAPLAFTHAFLGS